MDLLPAVALLLWIFAAGDLLLGAWYNLDELSTAGAWLAGAALVVTVLWIIAIRGGAPNEWAPQ